jgi:hypothetical protein
LTFYSKSPKKRRKRKRKGRGKRRRKRGQEPGTDLLRRWWEKTPRMTQRWRWRFKRVVSKTKGSRGIYLKIRFTVVSYHVFVFVPFV